MGCSSSKPKGVEVPAAAKPTDSRLQATASAASTSASAATASAHSEPAPLDPAVLHRLNLTTVVGGPLEQRLLAALSRPLLDEQGKVIGSAGAVLLSDMAQGPSASATAGSASSPVAAAAPGALPAAAEGAASASSPVGWLGRAQVIFNLVDEAGTGWVGRGECEALARAFLHGSGSAGEADVALKEYLEDLQNEGVLDSAVTAEALSMMQFADGPDGRISIKGFSMWLANFMSSLEEEVGIGELEEEEEEEEELEELDEEEEEEEEEKEAQQGEGVQSEQGDAVLAAEVPGLAPRERVDSDTLFSVSASGGGGGVAASGSNSGAISPLSVEYRSSEGGSRTPATPAE